MKLNTFLFASLQFLAKMELLSCRGIPYQGGVDTLKMELPLEEDLLPVNRNEMIERLGEEIVSQTLFSSG